MARALGAGAKTFVMSEYRWDDVARRVERAYGALLDERKVHRALKVARA
jgi:hypothetical protein